jgi:hypothetical protein
MVNTITPSPEVALGTVLAGISRDFRGRIVKLFLELKHRFTQAIYTDDAYDGYGVSSGKFCETVLRLLQQELTGAHTPFGKPIPNFADQCRKLEGLPNAVGNESLRVIIPRALLFGYTIRNKRGIGHVGGDVDANRTDMTSIHATMTWTMCELIRLFHKMSLEEAQAVVDARNTRQMPIIWEVMGKKRVMIEGLDFKEKCLLLAYATTLEAAVLVEDLFEWTEYSNSTNFKKLVLLPLHKKHLIEYHRETESVIISPLGVKHVEDNLLPGTATANTSRSRKK